MLYATLDQYEFAVGDYGRNVTFKIYQEDRATAFDLTGYAVNVRLMDKTMTEILQTITAIVTNASTGTGTFATTQTNTWTTGAEYHFIELELTKAGEVDSCIPIRVMVYESPHPSS